MNEVEVSVLVPAYRPDHLEACLRSVLAQTWGDFELVVHDDCPGDGVERVVEQVVGDDPRLVYRRHAEHVGGLANYEGLLHASRGTYIKFVNDDDLLAPDAIRRQRAVLEDDGSVSLVTGYRCLVDASGDALPDLGATARFFVDDVKVPGVQAAALVLQRQLNWIGEPTTTMFRRAALSAHGFDRTFEGQVLSGLMDIAWWLKLLVHEGDLVWLVEPLSSMRWHAGQFQHTAEARRRGTAAWPQLLRIARDLDLPDVRAGVDATPLRRPRPWWSAAATRATGAAEGGAPGLDHGRWLDAPAPDASVATAIGQHLVAAGRVQEGLRALLAASTSGSGHPPALTALESSFRALGADAEADECARRRRGLVPVGLAAA